MADNGLAQRVTALEEAMAKAVEVIDHLYATQPHLMPQAPVQAPTPADAITE